jgi:glutathione peroxidase
MNSIFGLTVNEIDGTPKSLGDYQGKVLLLVNVASKCGLTPQYQELEKLYQQYKKDGLEILGFPANDFGSQEPGSNQEIQEFCSLTYGVSFPMFEKISVTGNSKHSLYSFLISSKPIAKKHNNAFEEKLKGYGVQRKEENGILWNFEKFLIDRNGEVVERFSPEITPDDPLMKEKIESVLK